MIKRILFFSLLLPLFLNAQKTDKATVLWGEPLKDKVDGALSYTVGEYNGKVVQKMWRKKESFLQIMSADMERLGEKVIDMEFDGKDLVMEDNMIFGDKVLMFASRFDKKAEETRMFVRSYEVENLSESKPWTSVASLEASKRRNQGEFEIAVSPNEEKLLVYHYLPYEKGSPQRIGIKVLNSELNEVWSEEVTLEYADEDFAIKTLEVDDDGTVLLLGKLNRLKRREIKEKIKQEKTYYKYHLLVFEGKGDNPKNYELKLGDKFLQELHITIPKDGEGIICTGFYSEEGTASIAGSYYMKLDRTTKAVLKSSYHEFEEEFITMYMTEKQETKAKKKANRRDDELELNDFEVRDVVIYPDGSLTIVAEQYDFWVTTSTYTDSQGNSRTTTTYHYLYRDLVVLNLDKEGEVIWKARVPKNQYTRNDGGFASSYCLAPHEKGLFFIFNDSEKNLGFAKGDVLARMRLGKKDAIITLVHLDLKGEFTREALVEVERKDMLCIPKKSTEVDGKILLVAEDRKNNRFGVVSFK